MVDDEGVLDNEIIDDPAFAEASAGEGGEEGVAIQLKRLQERLQKAVEEKQEYLDGWQRTRADFANFKRDEARRVESQEIRSKVAFAEAVIPALDAFEMAQKDDNFKKGDPNLKKGIDAIYSHLLKSLERIGMSRFDPTGEPFNPHQHEALREVPTEEGDKDHVVESTHRAGYSIGERIVRPAQVSVYAVK